MMQARMKSVQCISPIGLHPMAYREWGDPDNPRVLLCVHGLTRAGADFDTLARRLCDQVRVICPDVVGRGASGRLANPALYQVPQYISDMVTLLARVLKDESQQVEWLGTSMGGLIGMGLASLPNSPISRLILNDIGPRLELSAMLRIADYLSKDLRFASFAQAEQYLREICQPFGPHSDAQWTALAQGVLAQGVLAQQADGQWARNYDPQIAMPFAGMTAESAEYGEAQLWRAYDAIQCPVLLVRGEQSDLLTHNTAIEMTQRGPKARLVELAGIGHATMFQHDDQIALVQEFLALA